MNMGVSTALTQYAHTPEQYSRRLMAGSLLRNSGQYLVLKKIWKWPCARGCTCASQRCTVAEMATNARNMCC